VRPVRTGPVLVIAAGWSTMVVAGVAAQRFTPFWFDPDEGCALLGRCAGPAADAALRALWALTWAGLAVVLVGTALVGRRLAETPRPSRGRPLPGWAVVGAGAVVGAAVSAVLGPVVLVAVLTSGPAAAAALCLLWLAQARAVAAVELRARPPGEEGDPSALPPWRTGLAVSAVGVGALMAWAVGARGPTDLLPVVDGVAVALGLLVRRAVLAGARPWHVALGVLVVPGVAAAVLVGTGGQRSAGPVAPALPPVHPAPSAPPAPTDDPPQREVSAPPPPPVDADVACRPADLEWHVTGWDSAMGTRSATVVATSRAEAPCAVDGFAGVVVSQGGRALRTATEPGSATSLEVPSARRVGLAPGGLASFGLVWEGHGAAADDETPQELQVTLAGADRAAVVPLGTPPAPFDLVDGATVRVTPWRAGLP
jgi:hypothetical protein